MPSFKVVLCVWLPLAFLLWGTFRYGHGVVGVTNKYWQSSFSTQNMNAVAAEEPWTKRTTQQQQPLPALHVSPHIVGNIDPEERVKKEPYSSEEQQQSPQPGHDNQHDGTMFLKQTQAHTKPSQHHDPLNIVLFYADDWTMNVLGKLNHHVKTPHLDQMADQGMLFTNNCVTTSVCWVSRATLMTGTYASRHGHWLPNSNSIFSTHTWKDTLFPLLKGKGNYYTGLVGKWHAPKPVDQMEQAWDVTRLYYGQHWMKRDGRTRHVTDLNRDDALSFLQHRPHDKPFALKLSFFATHAWPKHTPSYEPMTESKRKGYQNVTIPSPITSTEQHWKQLPYFFNDQNEGRKRWFQRFEPDYYQETIKDLYRMATEVDAVVGDVVEELKRQCVYNTTLLIFTTDNGNFMGEHGLAEKWYPFEESIRVPLIIQDPRMPVQQHGTTSKAWTLNVDLAPTLLGAAQLSPSSFMQGRDISELYLLDDNIDVNKDVPPTTPWREDFFYEYKRGNPATRRKLKIEESFALVTNDWKYIYWPEHDYEQLFHRSLDPYEEWDLLNASSRIQSTDEIYMKMKARYTVLKDLAQRGERI